jgi:hypothetical protein
MSVQPKQNIAGQSVFTSHSSDQAVSLVNLVFPFDVEWLSFDPL